MGISNGIKPLVRDAVAMGRITLDEVIEYVEYETKRVVGKEDEIGIRNLLSELKMNQTNKEKQA